MSLLVSLCKLKVEIIDDSQNSENMAEKGTVSFLTIFQIV